MDADFDIVGFIMDAESGQLDAETFLAGLQRLIDDGTVWHLQGAWQRAAVRAIENGQCAASMRRVAVN